MVQLGWRVRVPFIAVLAFALSAAAWWWYTHRPPRAPSAAGLNSQSIALPEIRTRPPTLPPSIQGLLRELNERQSAGITPDQNSAVLLVQAFGLHSVDPDVERNFLQMLGVVGPIEDYGSRLRPNDFLLVDPSTSTESPSDAQRLMERCEQSGRALWREIEFQDVAAWLDSNQQMLAVVAVAVQRPKYFQPMVTPRAEAGLIHVLLLLDERARIAARLLASRAMLRLQYGAADAAWDDILTCYRLGRLIGQGPFAMSQFVAAEIEQRALRAGIVALREHRLSSSAALRLTSEFEWLPPIQPSSAILNLGERLSLRDSIERMGDADQPLAPVAALVAQLSGRDLIRWEGVWESASAEVDKVVNAFKVESRVERTARLTELSQEWRQFNERMEDERAEIVAAWLRGDSESANRWIGECCAKLLMPDFQLLDRVESGRRMRSGLFHVALALEAAREEFGDYPRALDQLSPKFLRVVPKDLYTDESLHYERQSFEAADSPGYLLYSVFEDREDDGGVSDYSHPEDGDLVIDLRRRLDW